jgi:recombinational DNA repair ATPase RecF
LELQATNKRRVVLDLEQRLAAQREQKARVDGRLESQGEEGLRERLEALERKLAVLTDERARSERRARAAKLLYETLAAERVAERRDYVEPLAQRIESLGKIVYGPGLRITLNDELAIESRTLDDVSVPFDSLSTGAKEQLGVLARLACAQLVVEDGGAPLLLDDVLGHTDPERLERLAAVIAFAAKRCQVILFTSNPERYRGIGGAKFIDLART